MTRNRKFIVAGLSLAAISIAAAGAFAERGREDHGWRHHGGELMAFGGGFCRGDSAEMADHILVHIDHKVKPTDAQKAVFEELKTATRVAAEKMKAGCPQVAGTEAPKSPIERLDRAQARLETSLDAIKTVRPAVEKFYASLSDEQKSALLEHRGHGWRDREDGPGSDAPPPAAPTQPQ
jgi:LTXXQ motif family protein